MKLEELEQRILAIYDAHNGEMEQEQMCSYVQKGGGGCEGIPCESCPLSMGYLAKMMRKGRETG